MSIRALNRLRSIQTINLSAIKNLTPRPHHGAGGFLKAAHLEANGKPLTPLDMGQGSVRTERPPPRGGECDAKSLLQPLRLLDAK
jgi:hypothetical protein